MHHDLKLMEQYEETKLNGLKLWEFRSIVDRHFQVGDTASFDIVTNHFNPWDRTPVGRKLGPVQITYVLTGGMLPAMTCIFSHTECQRAV